MEGVSASFLRSFKGYWHRRRYQRLDGTVSRSRRSRVETARMGGGNKRRYWRIKFAPKLRFNLPSPKKLLIRLRDAYVNMMLGFANSRVISGGISAGFAGHDPRYGQAFARGGPIKEYDEKVLVEIYKTLMAQRALIPNTAGPNEIVSRRNLDSIKE